MKQSHRKYARHLWQIMTPRDLELVKGRRRGFFLCDVGIAGIREYTKVKCLNKCTSVVAGAPVGSSLSWFMRSTSSFGSMDHFNPIPPSLRLDISSM
ncbi:hypothetical protein PR003_g660 [Phytophthora rubi]|uniref:Uncharacterized protein n=1 Tax=Phytophthora rubi TaxID=129364 RepID=A0A6A3P2Z8_9STRA|nr:hypothetical protein PR002_g525 [Phytophthora rubi]KAE9052461.1 hypothetical protein PR001_g497 [Phytophthora rubi]KAE9359583.1 hypothetical protein PR003_g660 [Phytophthora rubi]